VRLRFVQCLSALAVSAALIAAAVWVRSQRFVHVLQVSWGQADMSLRTWPDRIMVDYIAPTGFPGQDLVVTHESDRLLPGPDGHRGGARVAFGYNREKTPGNLFVPAKTAHTLVAPFWFLVALPASLPLFRVVWRRTTHLRKAQAFPVTPPGRRCSGGPKCGTEPAAPAPAPAPADSAPASQQSEPPPPARAA